MKRLLLIGLLLACFVPGCRKDEVSGPPTLHLGRDECAHCGMIVSEERFSSALLLSEGDYSNHLVFDDIGCMLDYQAEHTNLKVVGGFVHDYDSRQWLSAGHASYVLASPGSVATPMGSGIASFKTPESAATQARVWNAPVMEYSGLPSARQAWKEARK